jgi:hypothetical protein
MTVLILLSIWLVKPCEFAAAPAKASSSSASVVGPLLSTPAWTTAPEA